MKKKQVKEDDETKKKKKFRLWRQWCHLYWHHSWIGILVIQEQSLKDNQKKRRPLTISQARKGTPGPPLWQVSRMWVKAVGDLHTYWKTQDLRIPENKNPMKTGAVWFCVLSPVHASTQHALKIFLLNKWVLLSKQTMQECSFKKSQVQGEIHFQ